MTDKRLTSLDQITDPSHDDFVYIVDVSDTSDSPEGTSRKIQLGNLPQASVNVRAYGAVGDGVTDDTQAFKDAIASLGIWQTTGSTENLDVGSYGGGEVFAPIGDYLITDTLLYTTGINFKGEGKGSIIRFSPASALPLFLHDAANEFKTGQGGAECSWESMTIIGDRTRASLTGNCTVGIDIGNVTYARITDVHMNGWDIAINNDYVPAGSGYYLKIDHCAFIYNRRSLIGGEGSAVIQIVDTVFVKHASTTVTVDYQIEATNTIYMVGGALEGGTIGIAHVKLNQGRFVGIGIHRDAGSMAVTVDRDGTAGLAAEAVTILPALGVNDVLNIKSIFDDPDLWWDGSVTSAGYLVGNSGGNFMPLIQNDNFKHGETNWSHSGLYSFIKFLTAREDVFMGDSAVYIEKTSAANHGILEQSFNNPRVGEGFLTFLCQYSSNAVLNCGYSYRNDSDELESSRASRVAVFGDPTSEDAWHLYVAWVPYYSQVTAASDETVKIGLLASSPIGSWAKFTNVQMYIGGYPLFPVMKQVEQLATDAPTEGHPNVSDRVLNSAPSVGSPQGWICTKRSDTTLSANALGAQAVIAVNDSTGWAIGDTVGVDLDDGQQHWSTIASLGPITLNDNLPSAAASGNNVTNHLFTAMPNL